MKISQALILLTETEKPLFVSVRIVKDFATYVETDKQKIIDFINSSFINPDDVIEIDERKAVIFLN